MIIESTYIEVGSCGEFRVTAFGGAFESVCSVCQTDRRATKIQAKINKQKQKQKQKQIQKTKSKKHKQKIFKKIYLLLAGLDEASRFQRRTLLPLLVNCLLSDSLPSSLYMSSIAFLKSPADTVAAPPADPARPRTAV